ncbi:hypothetical protein, partial [Klebsiella pneumoniae]|uniref:hypothetical protein n=1 Tax=Klebsiella pneumoniae TaxID=573 RepID=UPI003EB96F5F
FITYFDPLSIIVLILSLYQQKQKSMQILEWGLKISYDEKYLRAEELKKETYAVIFTHYLTLGFFSYVFILIIVVHLCS